MLVLVFTFCNNNLIGLAENRILANENVYAQYSGSTEASWGYKPYCTFTVNKIVNNKFIGRFSATNLGQYSFDEAVSGNVTFGTNSFSCIFTVRFYNNRYYSNIVATIDKINGTCECFCEGSWHLEDFVMTGTRFNYPAGFGVDSNFSSFSENDMKLCMDLSNAIYGDNDVKIDNPKYSETIFNIISNICVKNKLKSDKELMLYNTIDSDKDNAAFALTNRVNEDGTIDMFVVIRGTLKDEWQGNTEITGTSYDDSIIVHDNFNKGKDSIKTAIEIYYAKLLEKSSNINLIITGHSRGAAVANLYAKEATDAQNTTIDCGIPKFDNITAYTFACPNVEKYNSNMESYTNIFNFCFKEDLIPTVPLTNPTYGWNYWRYGQTYVANLSEYNTQVNKYTVSDIQNAFSAWEDVNSYYNSYITVLPSFTTLYKLAHSVTGTFMSYSLTPRRCMDTFNFITSLALYDNRTAELVCRAIIDRKSISTAHNYVTYNSVINGTMAPSTGDGIFFHCSYDSAVNEITQARYNSESSDFYSLNEYNQSNLSNLISFANQDDNLSILDWDLDDPSTWTGITWNEDGNAESVDLSFKNLSGSLDLSNFNSLKQLDVTGNNLTSLNLDNCSSLEEIDCSFNKLTVLDLSDCTNLTSVTCCYNYLDTHEGGTLYNTLDDLMFSDCYVNYYPQSVPDNAVFNKTELNALKTFAKANGNNSALDWLDSKGNIDTEKLQNNVLFEYDGSKYRIAAIDISDLGVSGSLNVTSLTMLKELYCENTKLTTLNVKGCTKLETLKCDGSRLTTLTLPSNAGAKTSTLYDVSCEYNYLDTAIFTENVVKYVEFKAGGKIEFENQKGDSSALQAALYFANKLDEKDYSAESFEPLKELIDECNCYNYDNLYLNQDEIDEITTDILTAMYDLKAYFNISASVENGTLSMAYNDTTVNGNTKRSILYGTTVTLNAIADSGYSFVGWYDEINNRYLSYESQYIFKADSNLKLKAIIVPEGSATLTFANYSNWVAGTVTKTTAQWAEIGSISDLLPDVPYRYGYNNGKWVYDEQEILTKLRYGENVLITAEYTAGDTTMPTPRESTDTPLLDLYYKYDNDNKVGSFVMAAGFPENIQIESVGVAFYYKNADEFDPTDNFILLMNNKMLVSRFNTDTLEDIYIVNINKMSSKYNWAARGYVTYYDETGKLVTAYSNQINIIDTKNADEMNTLLENDGQSVNNKPKPNIEYGTGEDD